MDWKLGEVQETLDPGLVLRGASGTFKVTGPTGETNLYECKAGYSIKSIRFIEQNEPRPNGYFLVEKIAEPITAGSMLDNPLPAQVARHRTAGAR
jgi:hypothetical protein